jgi:CRISPR/Cas system CSM-associated protein Csm5 (group 7 of RAMP superfamily)
MELRLRTLTPLHIGNGEELHSLDYAIYQNKLYRLPQAVFTRFLRDQGKEIATSFADWTIDLSDRIDDLEQKKRNSPRSGGMDYNQELSKLRSGFTYLAFAKKIGKEPDFIRFMTQQSKGLPIGTPQLRQQIRGLLKSGDGKAYLPGTSVKGAIRTALFFHVLENHISVDRVKTVLQKDLDNLRFDKSKAKMENRKFNLDRWKKSFGDTLENDAFYCPFVNTNHKTLTDDEKFDVLKFLIVSDGQLSEQRLIVDNVDIFLVKKLPKGKAEAQSQKQAPGVEAIDANVDISLQLEFNIDAVMGIYQSLRNGTIQSNDGSIAWQGFAAKIKQVFNIDISTSTNKDTLKDAAILHVMTCIKRFSALQLSHDETWIKRFKEHDISRSYSLPVDTGRNILQRRRTGTLLHLGYATGFTGTTELLYLVAKFKHLYKEIMEEFSIGDSPTAGRSRKPGERYIANPDDFPKSRRWIHRPNSIIPPGWGEIMNYAGEDASVVGDSQAVAKEPAKPLFFTGKIRQNSEIDAEIMASGTPNKIKLFISENNQPILDFKYGMGFGAEKVGRIIVVAVTGVSGKGDILSVRFVKEK